MSFMSDKKYNLFEEFLKEFDKTKDKDCSIDFGPVGTMPIEDAYFVTEEDTNES